MKKPIRVFPKSKKYKPWTRRHGYKKRVKTKSLESLLRRKAIAFKVYEALGKRKKEALITKGGVTQFFREWPEYRLKAKDLEKIDILEDREPYIKLNPDAKTAPGMYLPKEKKVILFPIPPENIPDDEKERAEKLYGSKERFPAVIPHELEHHSTFDEDMKKVNRLPLSFERKMDIFDAIQEKKAKKAEDTWLDKMRRRKR